MRILMNFKTRTEQGWSAAACLAHKSRSPLRKLHFYIKRTSILTIEAGSQASGIYIPALIL
jgi:hypothetical protein